MTVRSTVIRATAALGVGLLLTTCSYAYDASFSNPCDRSLVVRTFYVERGTNATVQSDSLIAEATLAPLAVTKVEDAFQNANGFTWFIKVVGGPTLRLSKSEMPDWLVTIPSTACLEQ